MDDAGGVMVIRAVGVFSCDAINERLGACKEMANLVARRCVSTGSLRCRVVFHLPACSGQSPCRPGIS